MFGVLPTAKGLGVACGVLFAGALCLAAVSPASAKDINLGGHRTEQLHGHAPNEVPARLPETAIALPRVVASVQNHQTGRWQRVLVDAYLEPTDSKTLGQMRDKLKDIAERVRPQLQSRPAEYLEAARGGTREAKACIQQAAEESLGHGWTGNVYIKSLAVF